MGEKKLDWSGWLRTNGEDQKIWQL